MDVTTYSSSFESDEDSTQVKERAENVGSRNLEFDVLCEGIRHLSLDSGKYTEGETKSSQRWVLEKNAKNTKCLQAEFGNNSYSSKLDIQNLNILKSVFYLNKKETCFKGSASINRRKKMQQIEHDNLILLKKLQTVKPSSEVIEWKKKKRATSVLPKLTKQKVPKTQRLSP